MGGWVTRRIVGYIVFAVVSSILGAFAIAGGYLSSGPTLSTACGAVILAFAFLVSFLVTTRMKEERVAKEAARDNARAWQEYYARQWQEYYARMYPPQYRQR